MDKKDILHFASHLKWVFIGAVLILTVYSFIVIPDNLISLIGVIIFLTGIYTGLESLGSMEKMSEKEITIFKNKKYVKTQSIILLSAIGLLIMISLLFLSLKFIFPDVILFNDFFDVGLDCWALILGLLCLLKSIYDKHSFATQKRIN